MKKFSSKYNQLEHDEPWSKAEMAKYTRQKRHFIRGIQLRDKSTKDEAIKESKRYFFLPNRERKEFRQSVEKQLIDQSPSRGRKRAPKTGEIRPIKQKEKVLPIKREKKFSQKYSRAQVLGKLNRGGYSEKTEKRIRSNMEKYPRDSLYQWQHGHNVKR